MEMLGIVFGGIGKGISAALGWMLKNPLLMLGAIFLAMFVMVMVSKNAELAEVRRTSATKDQRITTLQGALTQSRANAAVMNVALQRQNAAVEALQQQGVAAGTRFDQLIAGMAEQNATIDRRMASIRTATPGPDKCASAEALLRGATR